MPSDAPAVKRIATDGYGGWVILYGARTPSLGALTFPLVLEHVSEMTTVDDPTLLNTMFYLWERLKLVVEPTGALGAAAAFQGAVSIGGARVGVVLSGGNVDLAQVAQWIVPR